MPLTVAVAQVPASPDPRENGTVARQAVKDAAAAGARLVVLPEGHVSGYAKEQVRTWDDVDFDAVRAELESLAALAAELGVWLAVPSAHPLTGGHRPHNSVYLVDDRGVLVDRYDKRILSNTELTGWYAPGTRPVVVEVDGYRVGVTVCIEVSFPHLYAEYERLDVDLVLLPTYPVDSVFSVKAQAHAATACLWVAVCGPAQTADLVASAVYAPDGSVAAQVTGDTGIAVATLDREDPALHIALGAARPWRRLARAGEKHGARVVTDPRSADVTSY